MMGPSRDPLNASKAEESATQPPPKCQRTQMCVYDNKEEMAKNGAERMAKQHTPPLLVTLSLSRYPP